VSAALQRSLVVLLLVLAFTTEPAEPARGQVGAAPKQGAGDPTGAAKKLRVVVFGGHPDDPESGCGGLISLLTKAGHEVVVAYATCFRSDRKLGGEPEAIVRRREATAACKVLGATPHFFDYAHEKLAADEATLAAVSAWLKEIRPDIVVTHWPIDTHENHHVTSSLVWRSHLLDPKWSLYFFEVNADRQTQSFKPDLYLDIAEVRDTKKEACLCHKSQNPEGSAGSFWVLHEEMHRRRGAECGVRYAEAYCSAVIPKGGASLPVSFLKKKH
jgi:LmbE family N-acetylglucosaminyl deacetylase